MELPVGSLIAHTFVQNKGYVARKHAVRSIQTTPWSFIDFHF